MTETLLTAPFTVTDGPQRHVTYAELAAAGPIYRIVLPTGEPAWLISGYDEAPRPAQPPADQERSDNGQHWPWPAGTPRCSRQ